MSIAENVRPHHSIWPKRLPRALVVPDTTLWFNLEVSARRYPRKAAYQFFGQELSYAALHEQARALAGWLHSVGVQPGDRVALFMQNCPQFATACYGVWCANAVLVPVNPMNRTEEFKHYITDPQTRVVICSADLAGIVHAANDSLPEAERAGHVLVAHYADAMPPGGIAPVDAPSAAVEQWLRSDPPLPANSHASSIHWAEMLAMKSSAFCAYRVSRRSGDVALHLRHHRPAQGLHAHPSHPDGQCGGRAVGSRWSGDGGAGRRADVPHHRHDVRGARQRLCGCHLRAAAALGPRTRRPPDFEPPGQPLDVHSDHDHRSVRQPELSAVSTCPACATSVAAARRCPKRWRSDCSTNSA